MVKAFLNGTPGGKLSRAIPFVTLCRHELLRRRMERRLYHDVDHRSRLESD
jgi:hypothetical protein